MYHIIILILTNLYFFVNWVKQLNVKQFTVHQTVRNQLLLVFHSALSLLPAIAGFVPADPLYP